MRKRKKHVSKLKKPLDRFSGKRGPGRPGVRASEVVGRAYNYGLTFGKNWNVIGPKLLSAQTEEETRLALENWPPYGRDAAPVASLVFRIVHDPKFPKRAEAQARFFADSLAGLGIVTPRTSPDICAKERAKDRRAQHIIRYEYYIECSCGYKGPGRDNACPKCKTQIDFLLGSILSPFRH